MIRTHRIWLFLLIGFMTVQSGCTPSERHAPSVSALETSQQETYYPSPDSWERRKPSEVGMDDTLLKQAVEWARTQETNRPKDLSDQVRAFGRLLGPMPAERGDVNGIILCKGY